MATTLEIKERIEALARELAIELGEVDDSMGDCWLDAIENRAVELGDAMSVEVARQLAQQQPIATCADCPQCGKPGRHEGMRERELIGRRGPIPVAEPKYFCPCCRKAFFPTDPPDGR